ncbi:MAG TPA: hypothetical protein VL461_14710 [Dictyobacter sp.]|jgi:hypothetical protein|nr:hypothetical protein [Dictyobacter sp.]
MTTTGELRVIMDELDMVDIGDAASYLGEELTASEEASECCGATFSNNANCLTTDEYCSQVW